MDGLCVVAGMGSSSLELEQSAHCVHAMVFIYASTIECARIEYACLTLCAVNYYGICLLVLCIIFSISGHPPHH